MPSPPPRIMRPEVAAAAAKRDDDDDNMSVSSLGEEVFQDKIELVQDELNQRAKQRQAEELGLRLQVALQVPHTGIKSEGDEDAESASDPALAYQEFKSLVSQLDELSIKMSNKSTEILKAQNRLGRDTDMICEMLESTIKQAIANAQKYCSRIERLYDFREENRKAYLAQMQLHRTTFEDELRSERARSSKEWKAVADGLDSVQDERKSVRGLENVIRTLLIE